MQFPIALSVVAQSVEWVPVKHLVARSSRAHGVGMRIEINEGGTDGVGVSIHGVNMPEPPEESEDFLEWDKRWTSICNGIHALLGELGPLPSTGWKVEFWV